VGISNSGEKTDEESSPVALAEYEDEDAGGPVPSIRGALRALAVACWKSERFREVEAEDEM
jgi:hypothetical protein